MKGQRGEHERRARKESFHGSHNSRDGPTGGGPRGSKIDARIVMDLSGKFSQYAQEMTVL
jgi:hypothetical protein